MMNGNASAGAGVEMEGVGGVGGGWEKISSVTLRSLSREGNKTNPDVM
jgi:hypothetical protein